jgi:DNA-binding transcriptional regulator YdaS (Cro superfamily)
MKMNQKSESAQPVTFPELLRTWMGERSRADVAPILGVSWSTVHNWLTGISTPPASRVPVIAMLMALPVDQVRAALAGEVWPAAPAVSEVPEADTDSVGVGSCPQPTVSGGA